MNTIQLQAHSFTRVLRNVALASMSAALLSLAACEVNPPSDQGELSPPTGPNGLRKSTATASSIPLGTAASFAVLGGTTVTNDGPSLVNGDLGVFPGTAITGFQPEPANTIEGPGTVTGGLGIVTGTIYAGGPVAEAAHVDAGVAYNYLVLQEPDSMYGDVYQLDGDTFTPGVYRFPSSANLQVNGTMYLDFQGDSDALFIFQFGSTLVTMAGSNVVAINNNNPDCDGANVYWAVGSSATIDGAQFIGTVIAHTSITMGYGGNVSGRVLALGGAVTMITDTISICGSSNGGTTPPPEHGDEGCTLGYWKNHHESWGPTGYSPFQSVSSVFTGASATNAAATLDETLSFTGGPGVEGGQRILIRGAVASLLNAAHPDVSFPYTVGQITAMVNAALATGDRQVMLDLQSELDALNNAGCSLGGSGSDKVGKGEKGGTGK